MLSPTGLEADHDTVGWQFDNTYSRLPEVFFAPAIPTKVRAPRLAILNNRLAEELGLNFGDISTEAAAAVFAGQDLPGGSRPIAQAYAGHQYGGFTMLGDWSRHSARRTSDTVWPTRRYPIEGRGRTQFSRGGDGRAALGPMLREYSISEAMSAPRYSDHAKPGGRHHW